MKRKYFYVIENALLNVSKNKGRNLLQGVMIFAVITATVIALSIYNTSTALISEYKTRFGSEVSITPEIVPNNLPNITAEQTLAFSDSDYLQYTDMSSSLACRSDTLTAIDQNNEKNNNPVSVRQSYGGDLSYATMRLRGEAYGDFADNLRALESGAMPEAEGECIISSEFAELNNLSAGNLISLTAGLFNEDNDLQDVEITLTVVGVYIDGSEEYPTNARIGYQNRRNEILTTFETVVAAQQSGMSGVAITATYYLKSPEELSAFASEISSKGLPEGYKVDTDRVEYDRMVTPMEGLKDIAFTFIMIVLVLGAAIIILLSIIAIRERKYEIGVLRAMGMKKKKLAIGFIAETLIITCVCFILGLIAGGIFSQPISDTLLAGQNVADTSVNISVSPLTALQIFGVAMLLASIASIISVSQIVKYEPIKILMERN